MSRAPAKTVGVYINHAWEDGAREERQNVVACLRAEAEAETQTYTVQAEEWARRINNIADCIERGEHRCKEEK